MSKTLLSTFFIFTLFLFGFSKQSFACYDDLDHFASKGCTDSPCGIPLDCGFTRNGDDDPIAPLQSAITGSPKFMAGFPQRHPLAADSADDDLSWLRPAQIMAGARDIPSPFATVSSSRAIGLTS